MKKILGIMILSLFLLTSSVLAEQLDGTGNADAPLGDGNDAMPELLKNMPENAGIGNMPDDVGIPENTGIGLGDKVQSMDQLQVKMQENAQTMAKEMEGMSEDMKQMYQNQNQVREAVNAMVQMESMLGGIGPQVSEVAKQFDNSVQKTLEAEKKIEERGGFARFFAGGDKDSGEALEKEATQNQEQIKELKQLQEQCDCDEAVKTMLQEQIKNMEGEQVRLLALAEKEQSSKGMFGWLWK